MRIRFTVFGQAASKANSRRNVTIRGVSRSIKSLAALAFERDALRQIPPAARLMLTGDCAIRVRMFYKDRRSDLDESIVLDCLQARYKTLTLPNGTRIRECIQRGVVLNDRQFKQRHAYHAIDARNPRVEVTVWPLKPEQE